jgi:U3 small nucleolar RNA-associated protein 18
MGKHARKRQRKDRPTQESAVPLGTKALLDSDVDKDDDERRLESLLFGKPFVARRGNNVAVIDSPEVEDEGVDVIAAELEGLLDSDVSYRWDSLVVS